MSEPSISNGVSSYCFLDKMLDAQITRNVRESLSLYVSFMGIYQVQTNLSVQTVQTSIWATGSTSKGHEGFE